MSLRKPATPRQDSRGVSEVLGSVILLVITVAAFAVLFLLVQGVPKPSPGVAVDLQASLERSSAGVGVVTIDHLGGADLKDPDAAVVFAVNNTTLTYNISQGLVAKPVWSVGMAWRITLPLTIGPDTRVLVSVISYVSNSILYTAELQAGYTATGSGFPPIVAPAWAVASDNSNRMANDGQHSYRIHAVVIDPDGNLNTATGVWAEITVVPQGPQLSTVALGAGRFNLTRSEGSHYQSPDLVMSASIPPGTYQITVRAQDLTGGNGSGVTPPIVVVSNSGSQGPSLLVSGYSIAPISINTTATDVGVMRLNVTAQGGDVSLGQVIVTKSGSLPDDQLTLALWADGDASGSFDPALDVVLTPPTGFVTGTANIFGVPIATLPAGSTRILFVVASLVSAADGTNTTLVIADTSSLRGTGVPGGAAAVTNGTFPISSLDIVVGSKLSLTLIVGAPDRLLLNTNNVRILNFDIRAAGEPFQVKKINVTLTGSLPRSNAQCAVKINGQYISPTQSFDPARVARFNVNTLVSDAAGTLPMEIFLNVTGRAGQTLGLKLAAESETFAAGQISGKGRNGKSPDPFPLDSGLVALTTTGNLSVDEYNDTALGTSVRSGMTNIYLHTLRLKAHGEGIDFNRLVFYQTGNLTDGQFSAVTLRVRGGTWLSGTPFSGVVTWDAGVSGKLFNIPINVTNAGVAVVDVYVNLTTSTQGKEFALSVLDSTKVRGWGKTSLTALYANPESAPYPLTVGVRRIQGDVLVWAVNLAPNSILAPANLVPIMKITFKPVGENLTLDEIFLRALSGVPAVSGSVTVHLYRDVNNDTTTAVQGDDVDISASEAGGYGTDAFKAFAPAANVTLGGDSNFFFALDFTTSAAGFNVENRVNASNSTIRGLYSLSTIPPNAQIGITNPTALLYQTPPVTVYDRGTLVVGGANLNGESQVHELTITRMLRLTLTAAVENVAVTSIKVHLNGNVTGSVVNVAIWWDKDKDDLVGGADVQLGLLSFTSSDATFTGSPLITVAASQTENLIVRISVTTSGQVGRTLGISVTDSSDVVASGVTTSLGITPTGGFPFSSPTVPIVT